MSKLHFTSFFLVLLVTGLFIAVAINLEKNCFAEAQEETSMPFTTEVPNIQYQNRTVYISLWLINIYSFDFKSGSYTFDFYVRFFWTDPHVHKADWYLMNGYPAYPGAKLLVSSSYVNSVKWELYRVRANLNNPLEAKDFPFDQITLPISIELLTDASQISMTWLQNATGISSSFQNVGWTTPMFTLTTSTAASSVGVISPRADMIVIQDRNLYGAIVQTIFPGLIFCIVALVCFLFPMHEGTAFSLRVGINTSMLITAVLYNIAVQNNLPPLTRVTFYDVFIDSVISFLAISLVVTVLGYVDWKRHNDVKRVNFINKVGWRFLLLFPFCFT